MQVIHSIAPCSAKPPLEGGRRVRVEKERPGDVSGTHGDISRAREKLGYAPKITLEEGLARTVEWYNNTRLT